MGFECIFIERSAFCVEVKKRMDHVFKPRSVQFVATVQYSQSVQSAPVTLQPKVALGLKTHCSFLIRQT